MTRLPLALFTACLGLHSASAMAQTQLAEPLDFGIATPGDPTDVAISAERITLSDRVNVYGGLAGSSTAQTTVVRNDVEVFGDVVSLGPVELGHRTTIEGSVSSGGSIATTSSTSAGAIEPNRSIPAGGSGTTVTVPTQSVGSLVLSPDTSADWTETRYDRVSVGSRSSLTLTAGTWVVDRLVVQPGAELVLDDADGPITLVVIEALTMRGSWFDGTDDGLPPDLRVLYDGSGRVTLDQPFSGRFVGPDGTLVLAGNGTTHEGFFAAREVLVRPGITVIALEERDRTPGGGPGEDGDTPSCNCTRPAIVYGN